MSLSGYIARTQELLENPVSTPPLYATSDLTNYVNIARSQLAGESGCIRAILSLATVANVNSYPFSAMTGLPTGVLIPANCRMITVPVNGGRAFLDFRPWEWFNRYRLATTGIANAQPTIWTQYGQGISGTLYFSATPDAVYNLSIDTACLPIELVDNTTVEAIPYPWSDAVPFFAAYYAYMSAQRQQDAEQMFKRYEEFTARARMMSTPDINPLQFNQRGPSAPPQQGGAG